MNAFFFALMTAVIWGMVPILEKMGVSRVEPLAGILIRSCGVILGAPLLAIFYRNALRMAIKAEPQTISFLVFAGFMASVVGQIFFYNALRKGEASQVVPIAGTYPLISFLIGIIFLGESFTATKAAGVVFIILGLTLLR